MKKLIIPALAAVLIFTACGKDTPKPQTVSITLDSNPTTGFSWQVAQSEELFSVETNYVEDEHEEDLVGVGGKETITLTPLKAGKTEVTLTYARPWEGGEQADQIIYVFNIDKNLQVETVDSYSMGVNETLPTPEPVIN
ncbi:MAG: protease inhibitor I42 family protein [Oscillospiraceae bacterium]|nr:protease inhibitor I42 family protein [Oscillospiraceae bacterium]